MKCLIFGGFLLISGAIMFTGGSTDGTGNSWVSWLISLQDIGMIVLLIGLILSIIGLVSKEKNDGI
jgi:hypothetical protein